MNALVPKRRYTNRGDTIVIDTQVLEPPVAGLPVQNPPTLVPANITGWFFWITIKYYYSDPDSLAVAQCNSTPASTPTGGGVTITNALNGQLEGIIPPAATLNFPDSIVECVYDIKAKTTDSIPRFFTVETGTIVVRPNVTRADT